MSIPPLTAWAFDPAAIRKPWDISFIHFRGNPLKDEVTVMMSYVTPCGNEVIHAAAFDGKQFADDQERCRNRFLAMVGDQQRNDVVEAQRHPDLGGRQ